MTPTRRLASVGACLGVPLHPSIDFCVIVAAHAASFIGSDCRAHDGRPRGVSIVEKLQVEQIVTIVAIGAGPRCFCVAHKDHEDFGLFHGPEERVLHAKPRPR
jgi:hypothetical protein